MLADVIINPLFQELFNDNLYDKRYYQVFGGRGSGKSFTADLAMVEKVRSKEFKHKILILRQTMVTLEDSSIADVREIILKMGYGHEFKEKQGLITHIETGNTISFKGIQTQGNNTAKLKSLSGITTLLIEEAEEVESFEEYSKIDESIRVIGIPLKIILVYNPTSSIKSWIHKEWFKNGMPNMDRFHDTVFIHSTYLDNLENLAPSIIRRYRDLEKNDPTYYRNTILAEWTLEVVGRIYGGWKMFEDVHPEATIESFFKFADIWYGLDFGYGGKDSTSLIKIMYLNKKYYIEEIFSRNDLTISATVKLIKEKGIPVNAKIFADSAVPTLIEEVRLGGFSRIRKAVKGKVEPAIKKIQDKEIIMMNKGEKLYYSYMTFNKDKNGNLPHEPDELAALRYGINSRRPIENVNKHRHTVRRGNGGFA